MTCSVVVRTKDRPHLLKRCLTSIQNQRRLPDEVVIVNDAGKDVSSVLPNFPKLNIHLIVNAENLGRSRSGNLGVKTATGGVVCFLDDDDRFFPNHLSGLEQCMLKFDAKVAYSGSVVVRRELIGRKEAKEKRRATQLFNEPFDPDRLAYENYIPLINLLIERDLFLSVGGFDESFDLFEDWDLLYRLSQKTPFFHLNQVTTEYGDWGSAHQITRASRQSAWKKAYIAFLRKNLLSLPTEKIAAHLADYLIVSQSRRTQIQTLERQKSEIERQWSRRLSELNEKSVQEAEKRKRILDKTMVAQKRVLEVIKKKNEAISGKLHEVSKEIGVGISRSEIEKAFSRRPAVFPQPTPDQAVSDYRRLAAWIRKKNDSLPGLFTQVSEQKLEHVLAQSGELLDQVGNLHLDMAKSPILRRFAVASKVDALHKAIQQHEDDLGEAARDLSESMDGFCLPMEPDKWEAPDSTDQTIKMYPAFAAFAGSGDKVELVDAAKSYGSHPVTLSPGVALEFDFYCENDGLSRLDVMIATHQRINTCVVRLHLFKEHEKHAVRTVVKDGLEILDNRFCSFCFDPVPDSARCLFTVRLDGPNATEKDAVAVFASSEWELATIPKSMQAPPQATYKDLPQWTRNLIAAGPTSPRLSSGDYSHLFLLYGPHDPELLGYQLHVIGSALDRAGEYGRATAVVEGPNNGPVDGIHEIMTMNRPDFASILTLALKMPTDSMVWWIPVSFHLDPDSVFEVMELLRQVPETGLIVPKIIGPDNCIVQGYGLMTRQGLLEKFSHKMPANHPYQNHRRFIEAGDASGFVVRSQCIANLDMDRIAEFKTWDYQLTEAVWQMKEQGYVPVYEPGVCLEAPKYPSPIDDNLTAMDARRFKKRWGERLRHHIPIYATMARRLNPKRQAQVLVVDLTLPTYDEDSGSLRMMTMIRILSDLGCRITFFPDNLEGTPKYKRFLERLGVEVYSHPYSIQDVMAFRCFDFVFLSRVDVAYRYLPLIRMLNPEAHILYDTVDIHHVREARQAEIENNPELKIQAKETKKRELACCLLADRVLTVTEADGRHLQKELPNLDFEVLPNIHEIPREAPPDFSQRNGLVFIGNYNHQPNEDAVIYFLEQIFPLIRDQSPDLHFHVLGSSMKPDMKKLESSTVHMQGWVEKVEPEFAKRRIFVSPLRYGAGMKGKIGQALCLGLPVVTTSVGAEGMKLVHGQTAMIADDPLQFAEAVCRLDTSADLWMRLSENGLKHIQDHFSPNAVANILKQVVFQEKEVS